MIRTTLLALALASPAAVLAAPAVSPSTFVMKAGASDLYEITSSKLELNSSNPQIRQFAQRMIHDHTQSTAEVKQAAMHAGLHPAPPHLDAMQMHMVAELRHASGRQRDQLYIQQQRQAHEMALDLHRSYAANGTAPSLKMAASEIAPVVQSHIDMLHHL